MPFERWRCRRPTTLALRIFRAHHTELNGFFWAFTPAIVGAVRASKTLDDDQATATAFGITGEAVTRMPTPVRKWKSMFKQSQDWLRLSALMALASYFEVYLTSVVRLAIESDPGVMIGAARSVDGVSLLKQRDAAYSYLGQAEEVVDGEWSHRLAKFIKLFGSSPPQLKAAIADLDWIRRARNGVGHAFGRDSAAYKARLVRQTAPLQALSTERLQKLLGVVDHVAGAVDAFLLECHVGEYEALLLWHENQTAWRARHDRSELLDRALRTYTGVSYGRQVCRLLIRHYEAI